MSASQSEQNVKTSPVLKVLSGAAAGVSAIAGLFNVVSGSMGVAVHEAIFAAGFGYQYLAHQRDIDKIGFTKNSAIGHGLLSVAFGAAAFMPSPNIPWYFDATISGLTFVSAVVSAENYRRLTTQPQPEDQDTGQKQDAPVKSDKFDIR
ncbi:MAG: hypothetical protein H6867_07635 [Rhodospirillales bacterium]|nr:hypothetical protein [Rhodospirillales bacterium]MCB9995423.1 hypothetical protein [Rhodospirillales bacterium]